MAAAGTSSAEPCRSHLRAVHSPGLLMLTHPPHLSHSLEHDITGYTGILAQHAILQRRPTRLQPLGVFTSGALLYMPGRCRLG